MGRTYSTIIWSKKEKTVRFESRQCSPLRRLVMDVEISRKPSLVFSRHSAPGSVARKVCQRVSFVLHGEGGGGCCQLVQCISGSCSHRYLRERSPWLVGFPQKSQAAKRQAPRALGRLESSSWDCCRTADMDAQAGRFHSSTCSSGTSPAVCIHSISFKANCAKSDRCQSL